MLCFLLVAHVPSAHALAWMVAIGIATIGTAILTWRGIQAERKLRERERSRRVATHCVNNVLHLECGHTMLISCVPGPLPHSVICPICAALRARLKFWDSQRSQHKP